MLCVDVGVGVGVDVGVDVDVDVGVDVGVQKCVVHVKGEVVPDVLVKVPL